MSVLSIVKMSGNIKLILCIENSSSESFWTHYQPQKIKALAQATTSSTITIKNYELEVVDKLTNFRFTISSKLSLDKELYRWIGMTASMLAALEHVCGRIPNSLSRPIWQCITLVFLVHFYTEANIEQQIMLVDWMSSICAHCGRCLGYHGWAEHQTLLGCLDVDYQLCSRCFVNVDCDMSDGRIPKDIL